MEDRDNRSSRGSGAASRPPDFEFTEDTPLFTDVPYTPMRRTGNNGRPASVSETSRSRPGSSHDGGRIYSSPSRVSPGTGRASSGRTERNAPVYTELSWDDLARGADSIGKDHLSASERTPGGAALPQAGSQPRSGSQYFGGFDQEMEELFYGRGQSAPRPSGEYSARNAAERSSTTASFDPGTTDSRRTEIRPQSTRRPAVNRSSTPAPARRAASAPARSQWSDVFGNTGRTTPPARRPSVPVQKNGPSVPPASGNARSGRRRARSNRIPPIFLGGGLVLLALLIFLMCFKRIIYSGDIVEHLINELNLY